MINSISCDFGKWSSSEATENITVVVNYMNLETGIHRDVMAQFLSISVTGLIEWWIVESMPYTPEEMVEQMTKILEARLQLW
jgi:hypothetical protein